MELSIPAWFKYRQGVAEPAGDRCYKLTAPLADEVYIRIREKDGTWQAAISEAADGLDLRSTEFNFASERDAWTAAFDLYRVEKLN